MVSQVDIVNLALIEVGSIRIADPDEEGKGPENVKIVFPMMRDAVLRAHPWNFAMARKQVPAKIEAPPFGFRYKYDLPSTPHCLRVHRIGEFGDRIPFQVEGREILTDAPAPINLRYIGQVTDLSRFDALFTVALGARIGATIAKSIDDSGSLARDLWELYVAKLREARNTDAQEGTPEDLFHDDFLASRL